MEAEVLDEGETGETGEAGEAGEAGDGDADLAAAKKLEEQMAALQQDLEAEAWKSHGETTGTNMGENVCKRI